MKAHLSRDKPFYFKELKSYCIQINTSDELVEILKQIKIKCESPNFLIRRQGIAEKYYVEDLIKEKKNSHL
jgi:hypothetical protein